MSRFPDDEDLERDWVVDTNVANVANGSTNDVEPDCKRRCIDLLEAVTSGKVVVVIDSGFRILAEYDKQSYLKRPGPGKAFLKWLLQNRANTDHCIQVDLTETDANPLDFEEFPDHTGLTDFDDDDRKFVAVAHSHDRPAAICEAVDVDWWGWKDALEELDIALIFPCRDYIRAEWEAKHVDG